ncbi:hypothetical protein K505DRAFT_400684 [Melanomma pulvis-pyrius CBS 109.77]|uniref:Ankyrin n=1 Tax=Melanomma pulvis-pyrius CBS 109.77 TaxID=1314802 RepID=A0A6A6XJG8_9PLEO|nr:hypothetical protein K505DRAFT_400684 [Melanomma pulvis-pyrius CBS 109.77]
MHYRKRRRDDSVSTAVKWAGMSRELTTLKLLLRDDASGKNLRSGPVLCEFIRIWKDARLTKSANDAKWRELFNMLIRGYVADNSASQNVRDWANTILCAAARVGCKPVIEILFKTASGDCTLAKALLEQTQMQNILVVTYPTKVDAARILIEKGKADPNFSPGGEWYSPLRTAIRAISVDMCCVLALCGVNKEDVIEGDTSTGLLKLKDALEDDDTSQIILKELIKYSKVDGVTSAS